MKRWFRSKDDIPRGVPASELYEKAYALAQADDASRAHQLATAAAQQGSIEAYRLLGLLSGDAAEGARNLEQAAQSGDSYATAILAWRDLDNGRPDLALARLRSIAPGDLDAHSAHLLARASWLTGESEAYLALMDQVSIEDLLERALWPSWYYHPGAQIAWANYHLLALHDKWQRWTAAKLSDASLPFSLPSLVEFNHPLSLLIAHDLLNDGPRNDFIARIDPYGRDLLIRHLQQDLAMAKSAGGADAAAWCDRAVSLITQHTSPDIGSWVRDIINVQVLAPDLTLLQVPPKRLTIRADLTDAQGQEFTFEADLGEGTPSPNLHHHAWLRPYLDPASTASPRLREAPSAVLHRLAQWDAPAVPLSIWALLSSDEAALTEAGEQYVTRWLRHGPSSRQNLTVVAVPVTDLATSYLSDAVPWIFAQPEHNDERILRVWNHVRETDPHFAVKVFAPILALHRISGELPRLRRALLDIGDPTVARLLDSSLRDETANQHAQPDDAPATGLRDTSASVAAAAEFLRLPDGPFNQWPALGDLDLEGASDLPMAAHRDLVLAALVDFGLLRASSAQDTVVAGTLAEAVTRNDEKEISTLVRASWHDAVSRVDANHSPDLADPLQGISSAVLQAPDVPLQVLEGVIAGSFVRECAEPDHDPHACPRRIAASHPRIPSTSLRDWASHADSCLQLGVAANPNATSEDLLALADSPDLAVRNAILRRPETPLATLIEGLTTSYSNADFTNYHQVPSYYTGSDMYDDFHEGVADPRLQAIARGAADTDLLQTAWHTALSWHNFSDTEDDDDGYVWEFCAGLVRDVASACASSDSRWLFDSLIEDPGGSPRLKLAQVEFQSYLEGSWVTSVRYTPLNFQATIAASTCQVPEDVQRVFATTGTWDVRLVLATKPETTSQTLATIFDPEVIETGDLDADGLYVADHYPSAYSAAGVDLDALWPTDTGLELDANSFSDFSDDRETAARALAVMHPNFPPDRIAQAAISDVESIRAAAARSPHASEEILRSLAVDPDDYVRRGVADNPVASDDIRALAALSL